MLAQASQTSLRIHQFILLLFPKINKFKVQLGYFVINFDPNRFRIKSPSVHNFSRSTIWSEQFAFGNVPMLGPRGDVSFRFEAETSQLHSFTICCNDRKTEWCALSILSDAVHFYRLPFHRPFKRRQLKHFRAAKNTFYLLQTEIKRSVVGILSGGKVFLRRQVNIWRTTRRQKRQQQQEVIDGNMIVAKQFSTHSISHLERIVSLVRTWEPTTHFINYLGVKTRPVLTIQFNQIRMLSIEALCGFFSFQWMVVFRVLWYIGRFFVCTPVCAWTPMNLRTWDERRIKRGGLIMCWIEYLTWTLNEIRNASQKLVSLSHRMIRTASSNEWDKITLVGWVHWYKNRFDDCEHSFGHQITGTLNWMSISLDLWFFVWVEFFRWSNNFESAPINWFFAMKNYSDENE